MRTDEETEIITLLAALNEQMINQKKSMDIICEFKNDAIKIFQNFEDYKEERKTIPDRLSNLENTFSRCNINCGHQTETAKRYFKEHDFLMLWYRRIAALIVAFQIIIAAMVFLGRMVDFKITMP